MIQTSAKAKPFPYQKEVDEVCENELLEGRKENWSVIPSARSSETVRRQEISDTDAFKENLLWKSTADLNRECTSAHQLPVGVCGKVVARGSSELYDRKKPITSITFKESLPHPSKLKKKKRKRSSNPPSTRHSQHGFDVTAHVAQLRRKQAEFNWLPANQRDNIASLSYPVEEEPFPPGSTGPQCVPSTPTLLTESFELNFLPTLHNPESRAMDLFNAYHQLPQLPTRHFTIPSYAVARRERPQEDLQDEEFHNSLYNTRHTQLPVIDSLTSRMEPSLAASWLNHREHSIFSPENPFHPIISEPFKEE